MAEDKKLIEALNTDNIEMLKELKRDGYDFSKINIVEFVESGIDIEVLEFLLNNGIDANATSSDGDTVLMEALWESIDTVELLIKYGADVNATSSYGNTVLMEALTQPINIVELLIKNGADVNATSSYGNTVLMEAVQKGSIDIDIVELLIKNGADVNATSSLGITVLIEAIIYEAMRGSKTNIVELLIKHGADVNATLYNGQTVLMQILREVVVSEWSIDIVELLIKHDADVNATSNHGFTVLMMAIMYADLGESTKNIVELLIKYGADVNTTSPDGDTALMEAVWEESIDIAEFLIKHGADVNAANEVGYTALMFASQLEHIDLVNLLIENNADINAAVKQDGNFKFLPSSSPYNSLYFAAEENRVEVVKFLLEHKAIINKIIVDNALENNNIEILQLFIDHGLGIHKVFKDYRMMPKINLQTLQLLLDNDVEINSDITISLDLFHLVVHDTSMAKLLISKTENPYLFPMFYTIAQNKNNLEVLSFLEVRGVTTGDNNLYVKISMFIHDKIMPKMRSFLASFLKKYSIIKYGEIEGYKKTLDLCSSMQYKLNLSREIGNNIDIKSLEMIIKKQPDGLNKADINGVTALMTACKQNQLDAVQLLLKYKADIDIVDKQGKRALQYAIDKPEITDLLRNYHKLRFSNNPKRLVEILNLFTEENPIKYTSHSFEWNRYGSYENFITEVKQAFEKIEQDLKVLSPNLCTKIEKFLFDSKLSADNTWGINKIYFGWSSPELKEWCSIEDSKVNGKKAINFQLSEQYKKEVNHKTLVSFEDVCSVFKNEIEIRDDDRLSSLFEELDEDILGFDDDFDVEYINLEGITFYTDVEKFRNGLAIIFEQFREDVRKKHKKIKVEVISDASLEYLDLKITQKESYVSISSDEMKKEIQTGHFQIIKDHFTSLCDWSIETKDKDKNFGIKYLSMDTEDIEVYSPTLEPEGFTHILRFYK